MFPSNFTKEILTDSETPSLDSQEENRSGRTSELQLIIGWGHIYISIFKKSITASDYKIFLFIFKSFNYFMKSALFALLQQTKMCCALFVCM